MRRSGSASPTSWPKRTTRRPSPPDWRAIRATRACFTTPWPPWLAEKKQGRYANTPLAEYYLRRDSETYLGGLIGNLMGMEHRNLPSLTELIRSGPPPVAGKPPGRRGAVETFRQDLARYQKAGMADLAADLVASLPESPKLRCLLDLGAGRASSGWASWRGIPTCSARCAICLRSSRWPGRRSRRPA
jgi:hypothetical protein